MSKASGGDLSPRSLQIALAGLVVASIATKIAFAIRFDGFLTGDDLEVVQSALRSAVGYDYAPWSLRSLFHPIVMVAPILKLVSFTGPLSAGVASFLSCVPTALSSTAAIVLVYLFARRVGTSPAVALAASFLYAVHWLPWAYGATQYPRPISAALFLAALLVATGEGRVDVRGLAAGALLAAACAVRFSEGVLLLPLAGFAWSRTREQRLILWIGAGFAAGALLFLGFFDSWTWGRPFASLREFVRIMHGEAPPASATGDKPWYHYGANVLKWITPVPLVLVGFAVRDRRARLPLAMLVAIALLLSFFRYKQYRYLQAAIPFLAVAAAIGWDRIRGKAPAVAAAALAAAGIYGAFASVRLLSEKSQPAVSAARHLARISPPPRAVALEQKWAYGERLFLGTAQIRDVAPARPLDARVLREAVAGADAAAFYVKDLDPAAYRALAEAGMRPDRRFRRDSAKEVLVFRRAAQPRSSAPRSFARSSGSGATISISSFVSGWRRPIRSAWSAWRGNSENSRRTAGSRTRS